MKLALPRGGKLEEAEWMNPRAPGERVQYRPRSLVLCAPKLIMKVRSITWSGSPIGRHLFEIRPGSGDPLLRCGQWFAKGRISELDNIARVDFHGDPDGAISSVG